MPTRNAVPMADSVAMLSNAGHDARELMSWRLELEQPRRGTSTTAASQSSGSSPTASTPRVTEADEWNSTKERPHEQSQRTLWRDDLIWLSSCSSTDSPRRT